jgi:hypothetical protein
MTRCERTTDEAPKLRGPLVCGAHSGFFVIDPTGQALTIGVHFKPGGAFPFLVPAAELRDALVPLESLWGAKAAKLRDRLLDAATAEARFSVLEQTLLARTTRITARRGLDPSTTKATTAPTCSTPTATTSRRSTTLFLRIEPMMNSAHARSLFLDSRS